MSQTTVVTPVLSEADLKNILTPVLSEAQIQSLKNIHFDVAMAIIDTQLKMAQYQSTIDDAVEITTAQPKADYNAVAKLRNKIKDYREATPDGLASMQENDKNISKRLKEEKLRKKINDAKKLAESQHPVEISGILYGSSIVAQLTDRATQIANVVGVVHKAEIRADLVQAINPVVVTE